MFLDQLTIIIFIITNHHLHKGRGGTVRPQEREGGVERQGPKPDGLACLILISMLGSPTYELLLSWPSICRVGRLI